MSAGDDMTASVAVALTGGIFEQGLVRGPALSVEHIEAMLRHGLRVPNR